jgi:hypothetical protein
MTETPKSAARLLAEAARIAPFQYTGEWPETLEPHQLAALMAGGGFASPRKLAYADWARMIKAALDDALSAGTESKPYRRLAGVKRFPAFDFLATHIPAATVREYKTGTKEIRKITRDQCAAWLRSIPEEPSEHVRAWLGPTWQEVRQMPAKLRAPEPPPEPPILEKRIEAIVATAQRLEYDPAKVAWGGKAAIKKECIKDAKLFTPATFDKAWQAARNIGLIDVEDSETYRKR